MESKCSSVPLPDDLGKGCGKLSNACRGIVRGTDLALIEQHFKGKMGNLVYRHKPGTVISVNKDGYPIGVDNGDGTWSGMNGTLLYNK